MGKENPANQRGVRNPLNRLKACAPAINGIKLSEDTFSLGQRLTNIGYQALFKEADHAQCLDEIWKSASQHDFERLVGATKAPSLARFLSSQILLSKDMTFFSRTDLNSLSDVYIQALVGNYTTTMSDWGFLNGNDDMGVVGSVFLVFGERSNTPACQSIKRWDGC